MSTPTDAAAEEHPYAPPSADATATVAPAAPPVALTEPTAPRTRGAAIVWGLLFAAIAGFGIWTLSDDARREGAADWMTTLTPNTVVSLVLLAIGVLILVGGAVGLIRHAQHRVARAHSSRGL